MMQCDRFKPLNSEWKNVMCVTWTSYTLQYCFHGFIKKTVMCQYTLYSYNVKPKYIKYLLLCIYSVLHQNQK